MPMEDKNRAATLTLWGLTVLGVVLVLLGVALLASEIVDFNNGESDEPILGVVLSLSLVCAGGFSLYAANARYRGGWRTPIGIACLVVGLSNIGGFFDEYLTDQLEDVRDTVLGTLVCLSLGTVLAYLGYRRHQRITVEGEVAVRREEHMESWQYPSILRRYLATAVDAVFILAAFVVVSSLLQGNSDMLTGLRVGLTLALFLVYEPLCTSLLCTIGQGLMGIRVRSSNTGGRISLPAAYARVVLKVLLGAVSFFSIPLSQGRRGIHDLAAGSIVVYARASSERAACITVPIHP